MIQEKITPRDGEHVFIHVAYDEADDLSIDIEQTHGRRLMHVRVDGMGVATLLLDRDGTPGPTRLTRFCPYCGEELNLVSSKTHVCL